jgi:hypothetical protein
MNAGRDHSRWVEVSTISLANIHQSGKTMLSVLIVIWPESRPITKPISAWACGVDTDKNATAFRFFLQRDFEMSYLLGRRPRLEFRFQSVSRKE